MERETERPDVSDDSQIPMLVLTDALRSPQVRVGRIGGNFTLPRTVKLVSLLSGAGGAALGLMTALVLFGGSLKPSIYFSVLFGFAGVFITSWSPMKGESMAKWVGLSVRSRRKKIKLDGHDVTLAVGIAVLHSVNTGDVRILPGAVNIPVSQYDERGVRLSREALFERLLDVQGSSSSAWLGSDGESGSDINEADANSDGWRSRGAVQSHRQLMRTASDVVSGRDSGGSGAGHSAGAFVQKVAPHTPPTSAPLPPVPPRPLNEVRTAPLAPLVEPLHDSDVTAVVRESSAADAPVDSQHSYDHRPLRQFGAPVFGETSIETGEVPPPSGNDSSSSGWVRVEP